jgi:alpha-amylase
VSNNVTVEGLREGNDDEEEKDITIYVEADEAPYIYAWNTSGDPINGTWPGTQMTTTDTAGDGKTFWTVSFTKVPVNIIINNGAAEGLVQSADIENLKHDSYFTFDPSETDKNLNWTDITSNYFTPEPVVLPACAKAKEGHIYCYFQGNKDYDSPCAWVWNEDKNFCATTNWPGDKLTRVGSDNDGHAVWIWDAGEAEEIEGVPEMILFSNNGSPQTENFKFVIGGYYDATGLVGNVNDTQGISNVMQNTQQHAVIYNLSGQRVSANYRGIVIENGQKRIAR